MISKHSAHSTLLPIGFRTVLGEEDNLNHFNELPYQTLTSYGIENNFISGSCSVF